MLQIISYSREKRRRGRLCCGILSDKTIKKIDNSFKKKGTSIVCGPMEKTITNIVFICFYSIEIIVQQIIFGRLYKDLLRIYKNGSFFSIL